MTATIDLGLMPDQGVAAPDLHARLAELRALAAANRQPDVYEHPDDFVPDRWFPGSKTAPLLTFGYSAHFCLGAPTARAEMRVLLDVLAERHPRLTLTRAPEMLGTMMRRADRVEVSL